MSGWFHKDPKYEGFFECETHWFPERWREIVNSREKNLDLYQIWINKFNIQKKLLKKSSIYDT